MKRRGDYDPKATRGPKTMYVTLKQSISVGHTIHDDVHRDSCLESKHTFEAFDHGAITKPLYSTVVRRTESEENIPTGIGPGRKLTLIETLS